MKISFKYKKYIIMIILLIMLFFFNGIEKLSFLMDDFFDQNNYDDCEIIKDLKIKLNNNDCFYKKENIQDFEKKIIGLNIARIDFKNKKFVSDSKINDKCSMDRLSILMFFLNKKIQLSTDKSFSFFVVLDDASSFQMSDFDIKNIPLLMVDMDRNTYEKNEVYLVPDFYVINRGFDEKIYKTIRFGNKLEFDKREDIVFWRGSQTGGCYNMESKDNLSRYKLVDFSLNNPTDVDARFTNYSLQTEDSLSGRQYIEYMEKVFGKDSKKNFVKMNKQVKYKYIVSLDGNCSAWEIIFHILAGGSVLMYNTKYIQFFTPYLKEGIHFISIKSDMSDMKEKIDFLKKNKNLCKTIIHNGKNFASIMKSKLFSLYYRLVLSYIQDHFES